MSGPVVRSCPLCGSVQAEVHQDFRYEIIWRELERQLNVLLSEAVRARHQPASATQLVRCAACGLQYFVPAIGGDEGFYAELMAVVPYNGERWEFDVVTRAVSRKADIADFGCGDGAFLVGLRDRGGRIVGVDHNVAAVERLRTLGVEAHEDAFATFADRNRAAFDVVCSFHTLEHLPAVDDLIRPAVECLRPGGRLFVSVPNVDRLRRAEPSALDSPPHHLSRWSVAQLLVLGDRFGLEVVGLRFEAPGYDRVRWWLDGMIARRGAVGRLAISALRKPLLHLVQRAGDSLGARGVYGHSMLAEYRLPYRR